jgi:hypothetical protein
MRRQDNLETYRIIYKTSPVLIHDIIEIKQNSYNFRYNNTADIPRPRTRYGKKSFSYNNKKTILAAKQRKLIAQHYTKKNIKKQEGFEEF